MRLRRETGDFQIVVKAGETAGTYEVNSIRPGLSAEDLIGEVVYSGGFGVIITAVDEPDADEVVAQLAGGGSLTYVPSTGAITFTPADTESDEGGEE